MPRVREILEANEWTSPEDDDAYEEGHQSLLGETNDGEDGFDLEANELEKEMLGLRVAVENRGDDDDEDGASGDDDLNDDQLETLMTRVQAIRGEFPFSFADMVVSNGKDAVCANRLVMWKDMGSDMPESERKQFAAKAIRDIMKDI